MWFKTRYHLHAKEKINGVRKRRGCDSKHHLQTKEKINGVLKHGQCDSKHDITYILRKNTLNHI